MISMKHCGVAEGGKPEGTDTPKELEFFIRVFHRVFECSNCIWRFRMAIQNQVQTSIRNKEDLYAPFHISTTLLQCFQRTIIHKSA